MDKLHTNDISDNSARELREQLIENFKIIQRYLDNLDNLDAEIAKQINQQIADTQRSLDQAIADWSERVKHIVLGTDPETIELVVTKILEEKGLI